MGVPYFEEFGAQKHNKVHELYRKDSKWVRKYSDFVIAVDGFRPFQNGEKLFP